MDNQHHQEEEEGGDEIWLISYSDLMTLLFGFFVLMYVFASTKTGEAENIKEGLAKSFGGTYVPPMERLEELLKAQAKENPLLQLIEIEQPKDGMEITFRSNLLFASGSATLKPSVIDTMRMISKMVSTNVDDAEIFVGGHTDDAPISTRVYPSNWELSAARASSVVREFIVSGYEPKMLVALGYADARPAFPNRTKEGLPIPENREKNRRVVIKVVSPGLVKQQPNGAPKAEGLKVPPQGVQPEPAKKTL
ncbi:MAG: flagellar motor protein MotB [Bdellovibrionia bacterium]